jgi:hypothetical protein
LFEFNRAEKHRKVLENREKNKRKAKVKAKVGVKDIQWILSSINSSSKKERDLHKEYERRLCLNMKKPNIEEFLIPSRNCKQIKEDNKNLKQYESLVENNIEETKINRLKRIDNFIQSSYEQLNKESENLNEIQEPESPLSIEDLKNIEATSSVIDKYLSNEIKNYGPDYFKKKISHDKEEFFDLYKGEFYLLVRVALMNYPNLLKETNNFFAKRIKRQPGSGEFDETLMYFAFIKKMEEENYFNTNFIPGLCRDLTVNQLEIRKDVYWKAFLLKEEIAEEDSSIIKCSSSLIIKLLSIFKISMCEDPYGDWWDNY